MPRTGRPLGRPPKNAGEKHVKVMVTFPPDLARALREAVPARERSEFICGLVREALEERE